MNKLKTMPKQSKKVFLNFILPLFLMIAAVVIIGAGCTEEDPDKLPYIEFSYDIEGFTIFTEAKIHNMQEVTTVGWTFTDPEGYFIDNNLIDENLDKHVATASYVFPETGIYTIEFLAFGKDRYGNEVGPNVLNYTLKITVQYDYGY